MKKNSVMRKAAAHAPFNYIGGHPEYPQMLKGRQLRLCVAEDGLTLVEKPGVGFFSSEKVLLHIPREQLREVRDIPHGFTGARAEALVEVVFELNYAIRCCVLPFEFP